jgi:hypothetical protein
MKQGGNMNINYSMETLKAPADVRPFDYTHKYDQIAAIVYYVIHEIYGNNTFRPIVLMQDGMLIEKLETYNITKIYYEMITELKETASYKEYIKHVELRMKEKNFYYSHSPTTSSYYTIYSFIERWNKIFKRMDKLNWISIVSGELALESNLINLRNTTFYRLKEEPLNTIEKLIFSMSL